MNKKNQTPKNPTHQLPSSTDLLHSVKKAALYSNSGFKCNSGSLLRPLPALITFITRYAGSVMEERRHLGKETHLPAWRLIAYESTSYVRGSVPLEPAEVKEKQMSRRYYYIIFWQTRNGAEWRKQRVGRCGCFC